MYIFSINYMDTYGYFRSREISVNADTSEEAYCLAVRKAFSDEDSEGKCCWETVDSITLIAW